MLLSRKDLISEKLAEGIKADELLILTSEEYVSLDFKTPDAKPLGKITTAEAKKYMAQGQFGIGSMFPKVEASVLFLERAASALLSLLSKVKDGYLGKTGTIIEIDFCNVKIDVSVAWMGCGNIDFTFSGFSMAQKCRICGISVQTITSVK